MKSGLGLDKEIRNEKNIMSEFVGRIDQLDSIELDNELRNVFIK